MPGAGPRIIRKTVIIIKILPAEIALFLCARCGSGLLFWNGNHVLYRIHWDKIYTLFWLQDADKIRFDESTASFFLPHLCRIVFYRTFRLAELREKTRNCWLTDHMFSHLGPFFLYRMQFFLLRVLIRIRILEFGSGFRLSGIWGSKEKTWGVFHDKFDVRFRIKIRI